MVQREHVTVKELKAWIAEMRTTQVFSDKSSLEKALKIIEHFLDKSTRYRRALEVLDAAIQAALRDEETGHWGPDVTVAENLNKALREAGRILK